MNLHPLVINQTATPQTRTALIRQESDNLTNGDKSLSVLGRELGLNPQQIAFAEYYTSYDNHGSNGKEAAAKAYGYDLTTKEGRQSASNTACRNLKHPQVCTLMSIILDCSGLNNEFLDKRLMELAQQNADPKVAIMALDLAAKINNRMKTQIEVIQPPAYDFTVYTPEQLKVLTDLIKLGRIQHQATQQLNLIS